jgi:HEAT repeat protein
MNEDELIQYLTAALADPQTPTRVSALVQLADLKSGVPLEPIYSALKDIDRTVRATAAFALSKLGNSNSLPYLLQAWEATVPEETNLRRQILIALGDIGGGQAVTPLLESFGNWDADLQELAISFLTEKGEDTGSSLLRHLLQQNLNPSTRAAIERRLRE